MNKLQKKAWTELALVTFCMATTGAILAMLVRTNASGATYLIISLIVGLPTGLFGYLHYHSEQKKLDEREKQIAQKALALACFVFVMFCCCSSFVFFFMVGGAGHVPVYTLPAVFLGGVFFAQFTESAAILIQFAREQADD